MVDPDTTMVDPDTTMVDPGITNAHERTVQCTTMRGDVRSTTVDTEFATQTDGSFTN